MLTTRLPERVEPYKLAARNEHLEGVMPLESLSRLIAEVGDQTGDCRVWLDFGVDAQGRREIHGRLEADLQLPCRRCLSPMAWRVESEFLLGMATSDALAAELPGTHEPVLVENEQLDLLTVIEDELILSLPQVVYHEEIECRVSRDQLTSGTGPKPPPKAPASPFEVLKRLKDKS